MSTALGTRSAGTAHARPAVCVRYAVRAEHRQLVRWRSELVGSERVVKFYGIRMTGHTGKEC